MASCVICGGVTQPPKKRGQAPKYCSDDCRLVARRNARNVFVETHPELARRKSTAQHAKWRDAHRAALCAWRREHHAKHADEVSRKRRLRHAENPERDRLKANERYRKNNERIRALASKRRARADSREKARSATAEWRAANPDKARESARRYQEAHPEAFQKGTATRRARKLGAFVEVVDRDVVFSRDKGVCGICMTPVDPTSKWHIDHVIPLARGGAHCYENVQLAHARCNHSKHATIPTGQPTLFQVVAV